MVMESLAIRIPATRKGTLGVGCHQAPPEEEGGADDDGVYPGDPGPQLVGEEDARHHPQQAWTPTHRPTRRARDRSEGEGHLLRGDGRDIGRAGG